jgi:hypothetical protein
VSEFDPAGHDDDVRKFYEREELMKQAAKKTECDTRKEPEYFVRNDVDLVRVGEELTRQAEEADEAKIRALTREEYSREELFALHTELCYKALGLMRKKNSDYSTTGPFQNLKASEAFGVSAELGTLVRLGDKLSRIASLMQRDAQVNDESFDDTVIDGINYLILIAALRRSKESK